MYQKYLTGVIGDPVDNNPSAVIEQAAFDAMKLPWQYLILQVKQEKLKDAINGLKALEFVGFNVTMPFKQEIIQYINNISHEAEIIGAVNTVSINNGMLYGENTDGKGFLMALQNEKVSVLGKKIALIGAGGAARAISVELLLAGAKDILIINRSTEHGKKLEADLNSYFPCKAHFCVFNKDIDIPNDIDILVNATSVGFENPNEFPDINYQSLQSKMVVCDVIPNNANTMFLNKAKEKGCKTISGTLMLIYQGALSFNIWTGKKANINIMQNALNNTLFYKK
ncbi:MAG: shikimate dehydrogenase [Oribacterium sp.]|nr:shikimate dehydrogenase [Oribacterium sp.]